MADKIRSAAGKVRFDVRDMVPVGKEHLWCQRLKDGKESKKGHKEALEVIRLFEKQKVTNATNSIAGYR